MRESNRENKNIRMFTNSIPYLIELLIGILIIIVVLLSVAFATLAERKIMGSMQRRIGPSKVGIYGLLQP